MCQRHFSLYDGADVSEEGFGQWVAVEVVVHRMAHGFLEV